MFSFPSKPAPTPPRVYLQTCSSFCLTLDPVMVGAEMGGPLLKLSSVGTDCREAVALFTAGTPAPSTAPDRKYALHTYSLFLFLAGLRRRCDGLQSRTCLRAQPLQQKHPASGDLRMCGFLPNPPPGLPCGRLSPSPSVEVPPAHSPELQLL